MAICGITRVKQCVKRMKRVNELFLFLQNMTKTTFKVQLKCSCTESVEKTVKLNFTRARKAKLEKSRLVEGELITIQLTISNAFLHTLKFPAPCSPSEQINARHEVEKKIETRYCLHFVEKGEEKRKIKSKP